GLVLRAFEPLIQPGDRYTLAEVVAASGLTAEEVRRVRHAWGFPDAPPEARCFAPGDVGVLLFFRSMAEVFGVDVTMHMTRTLGTAMSRVAEAEIALIRSHPEGRLEVGGASVAALLVRYRVALETFLPAMQRILDAVHRSHLVHIGRRYTESAGPPSEHNVLDMVIGF